ncbi:MAG: trimethylamine methyltransferase family protein [Desulfobacterales bacterium]|nr:trimethylamine methyltransferase family protein [Desulfobacterales bacterium]
MRKSPVAGSEMFHGWRLQTMSRDALDKVHYATLDILQTTGVYIDCDEALDFYDKGGCWVNRKTRVVRIPPYIVNDAVKQAPAEFVTAGRDPKHDYMMGGRRTGFTNFNVGVITEDLETGEMNTSTKEDLARMVRLSDALEHIDIVTPPVAACDKPDESYDLHMLEASLINTSKHVGTDCETGENAERMIEMASMLVGGREELKRRPIISFGVCPTSPLQLIDVCCEVIIVAARNFIPCDILSMTMAGASSPISISGTLVTHNAEVLAGIVLSQLVNPGAPVEYGTSTTTFDMRHSTAVVGAPELGMISACVSEIAKYYDLPCDVAGG